MVRSCNNLFLIVPVLFTHLAITSALPSGIWQVNIDNGPSPSAEDGPPLSRGAIRDSSNLPFQIGSIAGAYLVWTIFTAVLILTIGRRLRRQAQTSPRSLNMEIVQPQVRPVPMADTAETRKETATSGIYEVTPISPNKETGWSMRSWGSPKKHQRSAAGSVITFDESVISDDRVRNEAEMDRLYAAVAEHEARRQTLGSSPSLTSVPTMPLRSPTPPMSPLNQNPPELQHLRYTGKKICQEPDLLPSPPPDHDLEALPASPTSPKSTGSPSRRYNKPTPLSLQHSPSRGSSRSSFSSFASFARRKTPSVRGIQISPPMQSPETMPNGLQFDATPMTPRIYKPGPPPPTPPSQHAPNHQAVTSPVKVDDEGRKYYFSPEIRSSRGSMSTLGYSPGPTPRTATFPIYPPFPLREEQEAAQANHFGSSTIPITILPSSAAPTPRAVPSTPVPPLYINSAGQQVSAPTNYSVPRVASILPPTRTGSAGTEGSRRPKPAPLALASSGQSNSSQTTLALRTAPLPLRALRSPNSTRPESTIKQTEVTRPEPQARNKGGLMVPGTAGMVPATPYSPFYMPMTPLTPMTPSRLVTREERKRVKKEERRRVLTQDDMVVCEEDMWGEGM